MRVSATAKYLRHSTRKTRLVTRAIVGMPVAQATQLLKFMPQEAARDVAKVLGSAAANAENNHDLAVDDLFIVEATANEGPTLKRFRPRAMGRATQIRKRTSHLTITLTPKED